MSHITNESGDETLSIDQSDSPLIDEGNCGGSTSGGGVVLKKGPWTSAEDAILVDYVKKYGEGNWNAVQKHSGLSRCGKSCRLRWANHLRPNLKKGAFTPDEETLIIDLHSKMGNKWARMAASLPGRTDNEIKNYWNTRIKRRQRAGLPPYPPEVTVQQAYQENQQNQSAGGIHSGDKRCYDLSQTGYDIPDVIFDSLNSSQGGLPYAPSMSDISPSGMLMNGIGTCQFYSMVPPTSHPQKRLRESPSPFSGYGGNFGSATSQFDQNQNGSCENRIPRSCDMFFPYDTDPVTNSLLPFGVNQGSHTLLNDNCSASNSTPGFVKLELPSIQDPETNLGDWGSPRAPSLPESLDNFIQSPPHCEPFQSDCLSPRNSGLLDALVYEAKTLSSAKNQSSAKTLSGNSSTITPSDVPDSSALNICSTEWDDYGDPISPLGYSTTSMFSVCTPLSAGSSLEEAPLADKYPGSNVKIEAVDHVWSFDEESIEVSKAIDLSRPDALLGSCWLQPSVACTKKNQAADTSEDMAMLIADGLNSEYNDMSGGSNFTLNQGWVYGSCSWNITPCYYTTSQSQHP